MDAAQVVIRIKLADYRIKVARAGRDLRQAGVQFASLAGQLGTAFHQARKHA